jgi:hypothetical protein
MRITKKGRPSRRNDIKHLNVLPLDFGCLSLGDFFVSGCCGMPGAVKFSLKIDAAVFRKRGFGGPVLQLVRIGLFTTFAEPIAP